MDRHELLTLMQLDRGLRLASVVFLARESDQKRAPREDDMGYFLDAVDASTHYTYKIPPNLVLEAGDTAAVHTERGFAFVRVRAILTSLPSHLDLAKVRLKWLLCKVDTETVKELMAEEQAALASMQQMEVKAKLNALKSTIGFDVDAVAMPLLAKEAAK